MSLVANLDDGQQSPIATNHGWSQFGQWAQTLDPKIYVQVLHLYLYGWSQQLDVLEQQLGDAVKSESPDEDVQSVAESLLELIKKKGKATVITVGGGMDSQGAGNEGNNNGSQDTNSLV